MKSALTMRMLSYDTIFDGRGQEAERGLPSRTGHPLFSERDAVVSMLQALYDSYEHTLSLRGGNILARAVQGRSKSIS
jgi:hypothetical protein